MTYPVWQPHSLLCAAVHDLISTPTSGSHCTHRLHLSLVWCLSWYSSLGQSSHSPCVPTPNPQVSWGEKRTNNQGCFLAFTRVEIRWAPRANCTQNLVRALKMLRPRPGPRAQMGLALENICSFQYLMYTDKNLGKLNLAMKKIEGPHFLNTRGPMAFEIFSLFWPVSTRNLLSVHFTSDGQFFEFKLFPWVNYQTFVEDWRVREGAHGWVCTKIIFPRAPQTLTTILTALLLFFFLNHTNRCDSFRISFKVMLKIKPTQW